jgi:hypothetical protein
VIKIRNLNFRHTISERKSIEAYVNFRKGMVRKFKLNNFKNKLRFKKFGKVNDGKS